MGSLVARIAGCYCDVRCDSNRTPPSDANFFFSGGYENPLACSDLTGNMPQKLLRKSCDLGLQCEMLACILRSNDVKCLRFGLLLRFGLGCEPPRCQIATDVGRAMQTTKIGSQSPLTKRISAIHMIMFKQCCVGCCCSAGSLAVYGRHMLCPLSELSEENPLFGRLVNKHGQHLPPCPFPVFSGKRHLM